MEFIHKPVLLDECITGLNIKPDGIYIDGTAGGGGHSFAIAQRLTAGGRLFAFDRDKEAIAAATERLAPFADRVTLINREFSQMADAVKDYGITGVDGILLDIGVSSYQLDNRERGFSYMGNAPLDMRMDQSAPVTAADIVNTYPEREIENIIYTYGEERWARRIAQFIAQERQIKPIETTFDLNEIINKAIPKKAREANSHPSKRTFQALRIAVNDELGELTGALEAGCGLLNSGGRFCVITFHSLEDRIVKQFFTQKVKGCICPPEIPVCVCGRKPELTLVSHKPITAAQDELSENPRSHSAKLRVAEKI